MRSGGAVLDDKVRNMKGREDPSQSWIAGGTFADNTLIVVVQQRAFAHHILHSVKISGEMMTGGERKIGQEA